MRVMLVSIQEYTDIREEAGIEMIAAFLRGERHDVKIVIVRNAEEIKMHVIEEQPEVVGICAYLNNKSCLLQICETIKSYDQDIFIGVGGYLPSFYAEELLGETKYIDVAILGEGELVWQEIVKTLQEKGNVRDICGVAYVRDDKVIINKPQEIIKDMDAMPFQCRDMLVENHLKYAYISSSRGCEGYCTFCCSSKFWKHEDGHWKGRCVNRIVDEIENLIQTIGVYSFHIQDNSFEDGMQENKVLLFARELLRRNLDISYHLNIRAEFYKKLTDEDIALLKKSGLISFFIGIESGNNDDIRFYGKRASLEDNYNAMMFYKKHNIFVDIGFINFNPYSTIEKLRCNIEFLRKVNKAAELYLISSRLMIFKGTSLYDKICRDGLLKEGDYADYYKYTYIDKNIGMLANYVHNVFERLISECNYSRILIYSLRYRYVLENLKRRVSTSWLDFIEEIDLINDQIVSQISENNADWFNKLLEMLKDWSEEEAAEITEYYLSEGKIKDYIMRLEKNNGKLLKALIKNKEYIEIYQSYI